MTRKTKTANDLWLYDATLVLHPSLWISGMLNDAFVSGLPAFVGLSVHQQLSRSLQCMHASVCRFHALDRNLLFSKS